METGFKMFHPAAQLLFFVSVISVTMFVMHPVITGISFIASVLWILCDGGICALLRNLKFTAVTSAMIIIINPLISHNGMTAITYFPDGNPLTLESVYFGIAAAVMISCTLKWFYSFNRNFTSDKIICLFGRIMPKPALLISMTLGFIEKFKTKMNSVSEVQKIFDCYSGENSLIRRIKSAVRIFSVMIQWSLENSIDTADSMKSRGYGLQKRTAYTLYRFLPRDGFMVAITVVCDLVIIAAVFCGALEYSYYPYFLLDSQGIVTMAAYAVFALLCTAPLIVNILEEIKWKSIRSKI